ncbi:MAG: hypothetical protein NXI16_01295 [Alphaproteobacteria bacterium]|nr:hypothetical protein [Alphaproteobacteria bacterium]
MSPLHDFAGRVLAGIDDKIKENEKHLLNHDFGTMEAYKATRARRVALQDCRTIVKQELQRALRPEDRDD